MAFYSEILFRVWKVNSCYIGVSQEIHLPSHPVWGSCSALTGLDTLLNDQLKPGNPRERGKDLLGQEHAPF